MCLIIHCLAYEAYGRTVKSLFWVASLAVAAVSQLRVEEIDRKTYLVFSYSEFRSSSCMCCSFSYACFLNRKSSC